MNPQSVSTVSKGYGPFWARQNNNTWLVEVALSLRTTTTTPPHQKNDKVEPKRDADNLFFRQKVLGTGSS